METELVSAWHARRALFPQVLERSLFPRHLRNLMPAINLIRQAVVALREWAAHGATFTQRVPEVVTKKQTIFGDTLHLLVTLNGVILDFVLAPAHASDLSVGEELRSEHTDVVVLGDKGYNGKC